MGRRLVLRDGRRGSAGGAQGSPSSSPLPLTASPGPYHLEAAGTLRNVTLALASDRVRALLPAGLELGPQSMTPSGTHPVLLGFHDVFGLRTSWPSPVPALTYREFGVGIPHTYVAHGRATSDAPGPYFYLPALLLESALATLGGMAFWGFPKGLGRFDTRPGHYAVGYRGRPLATLTWTALGPHRPVEAYGRFGPHREALSQPLLGLLPFGGGPFFVASDFVKRWDAATVRPLETAGALRAGVGGLAPGRFPEAGRSAGIDTSSLGSYELRTRFRISLPRPVPVRPRPAGSRARGRG